MFPLPPGSRLVPGRRYPAVTSEATKRFHVYRFHPEKDQNPSIDSYPVSLSCKTVLQGLEYIRKHFDPKLTFRSACSKGVCGSCAMNINGTNTLACVTPLTARGKEVIVYPLPHMEVIRDLIVDLTHAHAQYASIQPWLKTTQPTYSNQERLQTPEQRQALDGLWECILCFCCTTSCPSYWWNGQKYLGPAALISARRWLADSRDQAREERLGFLDDAFRLYRCHTILNCVKTCPKNLNPAKAIAQIKKDVALLEKP